MRAVSEKSCLCDFNAIPVNLHWRKDSKVFPAS